MTQLIKDVTRPSEQKNGGLSDKSVDLKQLKEELKEELRRELKAGTGKKQAVLINFDKELYRKIKTRAAELDYTVTAYLSNLAKKDLNT